ncbi:MAG TPA: MBL fold metallo-hydrolase [Polyangia bacterium]|nr:MBL fold metallo-hydrolase [Polyangia bacterium]
MRGFSFASLRLGVRLCAVLGLGLGAWLGAGCGNSPLTVQTYSGSADSTAINAHLVLGERSAILVDTGYLRADADAIVERIRSSGRTLRMIVITHPHPDHYFGTQVITNAFPGVPVVTSQAVLTDFQASAPGTFAGVKAQLGDLIADALVTPTALAASEIELDGRRIRVLQQPQAGESHAAILLGLDEPRALLAGDLVYNNVHLVLAECQPNGWKQDLDYVRGLGYPSIYPGHGASPATMAALDADSQYIDRAVTILNAAATADEAKAQLTAQFPGYAGPAALNLSVDRYFQGCRN